MKTLKNKMKKDLFSVTKRKIIEISITIVFLCLIAFSIVVQIFYSSRVLNNVDNQLLEQAKFFKTDTLNEENKYFPQINMPPAPNFQIKPEDKSIRIPPNLVVIIYEDDKFQVMSNNLYFRSDNLPTLPKNSENKIVTFEYNDYSFRAISVVTDKYEIQILANIDSEMASVHSLMTSIIFSFVVLIVIALFMARYLASKVVKPVRDAYEKQVYFVQDASHEMRTPLAVIKGKLELLAKSPQYTVSDQFEHISKMMSEIRGLEKLNTDLLLLSKEDLEIGDNITKFKLNDFVDDISEFYVDLAEIKEKEFEVIRIEKDLDVEWDYIKIKRAIVILIENAFKYTNDDGKILLKFEESHKNIRVSVKDNGIGIREEEKSRIFDRFYRSEYVRGKNISGTGIGLSLLKSISKNFGIKLSVESEYNKGSEFILEIPKNIKI